MSNRNPSASYRKPAQALPFFLEEWARANIRTSLPGIIRAYDGDTKRARVQPGLRALIAMEDGSNVAEDRSLILDVPVMWPGGGGFVFASELNDGDVCFLCFSERGTANFKQAWDLSDPPPLVQFDWSDAWAIPIGSKNIAAVSGATIQHISGDPFVRVDDNSITLTVGNTTLLLNNGGMQLTTSAGTQTWGSP